jgi:hypothetical protein
VDGFVKKLGQFESKSGSLIGQIMGTLADLKSSIEVTPW